MDKLINDFSYGLFFWQVLIFVALIFILKKFAWKPILNAVNEREEGIINALAEAENARKEMLNLTADNERILKEARNEREELLKDARNIRKNMISKAKEEAQAEAEKLIVKAKESIENEKHSAITDFKKQVAELSVNIAEKLLKDQLSSNETQVKLIDNMLKDVKLN